MPTLQETANHFGFRSPNAVREHFRLIEKKGFLHRLPGRSRGLVVVRHEGGDLDSVQVPLVGRIPAGQPVLAQENVETFLALPAHLFRGSDLFALRVRGNSMTGAGILDGDIAILDAIPLTQDGTIAAVAVEDEATLKRVYRRRSGLLLRAENPRFQDIRISASQLEQTRVLGVLVGVVRKI